MTWIRTTAPGLGDPEVLELAVTQQRLLLTFDKDFGELAFRTGLPTGCGILLFRFVAASSALLATQIVAAVQSRSDWSGHFSVVEPGRIRMRPLPAASE